MTFHSDTRANEPSWSDYETCRFCQHPIIENALGDWYATDATGDDEVWRESCPDNHTEFAAPHEPERN